MAKQKALAEKLETFSTALEHMKAGKKVARKEWGRHFSSMRIDDTGLGNEGEFIRLDGQNRPNRYVIPVADILAEDWILL